MSEVGSMETGKEDDKALCMKRCPDTGEMCKRTAGHQGRHDPMGIGESAGWETFCDRSYYDMWAVRRVGERQWGHCFHLPSKDEAAALLELLSELRGMPRQAESQPRENDKPPMHWKDNDGWKRHPQTEQEWNWHDDNSDKRSELRLNFAQDLADPHAPDQMALVLRTDLIRMHGRMITAEAYKKSRIRQDEAEKSAPIEAEVAELRGMERGGEGTEKEILDKLAFAMMTVEIDHIPAKSLEEVLLRPSEVRRTYKRLLVSGEAANFLSELENVGLRLVATLSVTEAVDGREK